MQILGTRLDEPTDPNQYLVEAIGSSGDQPVQGAYGLFPRSHVHSNSRHPTVDCVLFLWAFLTSAPVDLRFFRGRVIFIVSWWRLARRFSDFRVLLLAKGTKVQHVSPWFSFFGWSAKHERL